MKQRFPELDEVRVTVDPAVRERHLLAIEQALAGVGSPRRFRRRLLAVALAVLLLLPVLAAAAQEAVPGDVLYPVKQAFEPVISLFDDEYAAERRVTELEEMIERDLPHDAISDHVEDARRRVTDDQRDLVERIDSVADRLEETADVVEDVDLGRLDSDGSNLSTDTTGDSVQTDDSDDTTRDTTDETEQQDDSS